MFFWGVFFYWLRTEILLRLFWCFVVLLLLLIQHDMTKAIETHFVMKNVLKLSTDLDYYKCRNKNPFSIQQTSAVIFALILMNFLFGGEITSVVKYFGSERLIIQVHSINLRNIKDEELKQIIFLKSKHNTALYMNDLLLLC